MSKEFSPVDRSDADFAAAFDDMLPSLVDQMQDPHVATIHASATRAADYLNEHPDEADAVLKGLVDVLDRQWGYFGEVLELTAPVWVSEPHTGNFITCAQLTNARVLSQGFMIRRKGLVPDIAEVTSLPFRAAHCVQLAQTEHWPAGAEGVVFLEDITQLTLPYPSDAMREKNLAYRYPELAHSIDEIVAAAGRPDQTLKGLGSFSIEAEATDDGQEMLRDARAYLDMHIPVEAYANYRMEVQGDVIRIDDEGDLYPLRLVTPLRWVTLVKNISLLPVPGRIGEDIDGPREYLPYLHLTVLEPDEGILDAEWMVPCRSINWVSSSRYDQTVAPTYPDGEVADE